MRVVSQTGQTAQDAAQWLRWADQDYLAARNLLLHGLIVQGCGLATTAIEKYLKTVLLMKSIGFPRGNRGHNVVLLYEKLMSAGVGLGLNLEFLTLLVKAYSVRYPDDLKPGFNIVLEQTKILVELDTTVHKIRRGFQFKQQNGNWPTTLEALVEAKNEQLLDRNCVISSASRRDLFAGPTQVHELRMLSNGTALEATYETQGIADDGKFDAEALKPGQS
jgi:HEPN domain-containing protein